MCPSSNGKEDKKVILIVDDDKEVLEYVVMTLSEQGYECLVTQDGDTGLQLILDNHVDLLITDIYLPKLNGLELIQTLRVSRPLIKTLAISGEFRQHSHDALKWAKSLGAFDTLEKPFSPEDLITKVTKLFSP